MLLGVLFVHWSRNEKKRKTIHFSAREDILVCGATLKCLLRTCLATLLRKDMTLFDSLLTQNQWWSRHPLFLLSMAYSGGCREYFYLGHPSKPERSDIKRRAWTFAELARVCLHCRRSQVRTPKIYLRQTERKMRDADSRIEVLCWRQVKNILGARHWRLLGFQLLA